MIVDEPNISIDKKTNEQNIQAIKAWASTMTDQIQFLSAKVDALEALIGKE